MSAIKIEQVICSPGRTGFYADDQKAIRDGARIDGLFYDDKPQTPGFRAIRQPGESISVIFRLTDGQVAFGDCSAVQYSGAGGRDPLFLANDFIQLIETEVTSCLSGRPLTSFRELAGEFENVQMEYGKPLHTAVQYGVSQAILNAVAAAHRTLPCEVIANEYGLAPAEQPVRIFCQSGDDRYLNADKMILKEVDVLPHGLINNIPDKLGEKGEKLLDYVKWLRDRIIHRRANPDYQPDIHLDVYGTIGLIFEQDIPRIATYLDHLGKAAHPFALRVECPLDAGSREAQSAAMVELRAVLKSRGIGVEIVADEWSNTLEDICHFADAGAADMVQVKTPDLGGIQNSIEAVLYCKSKDIGVYLGGSCNETDASARACVHVALATQPDQMLAKPGMGVDEGYMIMYNEMQRALAILAANRRTER